ncbi:MAG TPA: topoisomerase C-terminal repeat-containing protein, partial [Pseudobdellovibrionaceae bacterium]|nr:topoisomerase C-terminal repeat-containing protein [Pseudobdellovibrionaceae bacterium]
GQQLKLYELIWKRTVASQMVDSRQLQVSVKILARVDGTENVFSASGTTIEFPGYLRAYVEGSDDPDAELAEREVRLPKLSAKDKVLCRKADPTQHETKPPSRFTEASLVQTMEKEGIGRPSTYASVISTIIDRGYVKKQGNALAPTFTAMVVSKLLSQHLPEYVDLGFTSEMEQSLDNIAEGDLKWEKYLASIYHGPKGLRALVDGQEKNIDPEEARSIRLDGLKNVTFHVGRFGAYMTALKDGQEVRASIPETESPADFTNEVADRLIEQKLNGADSLGKDPVSGLPVYALNGRYGPYVQLGDAKDEDKPKRASLLPGMKLEDVTLEQALGMLALPKTLGAHPETKKDIKVGIGRFGPYVVHDGDFRSIPKGEDVFHLSFARAMELLSLPKKGRGKQAPLKVFGVHPQLQEEIQLLNGKYGPYLKSGKVNASLPEGVGVDALDEKQAIAILNARIEVLPPAKVKGAKAKTSKASKASASADSTSGPAKKADSKPAKKAAAKKPPQKKPASQKEVANKTEVKVKVRKK